MYHPVWWEDGSVVCNWCWSSPAQSFSNPSPAGLMTIFYDLTIRDSPDLECQVPVCISPRNRVARLHPQALGFLFVASYDSQGYGGGIRPRLHTGHSPVMAAGSRYIASARTAQKTPVPAILLLSDDAAIRPDRTENTVPLLRAHRCSADELFTAP
jgi:hypothetical protein